MEKAKKKENLFKISSFLFGLGLSCLVFVGLIFFLNSIAEEDFFNANLDNLNFANCIFAKFNMNDTIFTECTNEVREYGDSWFEPDRMGTIFENGTSDIHYSIGFNGAMKFYDTVNLILLLGLIFGISCLIGGFVILRFKNY